MSSAIAASLHGRRVFVVVVVSGCGRRLGQSDRTTRAPGDHGPRCCEEQSRLAARKYARIIQKLGSDVSPLSLVCWRLRA
ncbi:hypothetical protein IscW_ISCW007266 [Ixodes scapularis]|uniref:Uncharacterized protein n=1 Tax=Ixodes scapularis TaxID=6945 RepID=B7PTB6_IXOSC|nr:hypothetical protein IscW_ISCW007266 [Ixodes scapularis]|eukprot:XP_002404109.1 hypothetical protein IscW_ISCW007266 [Ixodes scapularis]